MSGKKEVEPAKGATLAQYLAAIRADRKVTLREVEEGTDREVSNAYLSQIESGKIKQPSANILSKLAAYYEIDFQLLMELAGYVTPGEKPGGGKKHLRSKSLLSDINATPEEEAALLEHLQYLRWKKKQGS